MFKKIVSFVLVLTLVLGCFTVVFAAETVTPRSNMATYHTQGPWVGKASDYTILDSTKKGSIGYEGSLISLGAAGVTLLLSKSTAVAAYVKVALDAATIGAGVYAAYKAYNAQYSSDLFYTVKVYKYKSNGPHIYAFKYVTTFYANSARTISVYTTTEYYTYVI